MSNLPEYGLTITRTAKGHYHCTLWHRTGGSSGPGRLESHYFDSVADEFTSKKLPGFMWQLAKRILPK